MASSLDKSNEISRINTLGTLPMTVKANIAQRLSIMEHFMIEDLFKSFHDVQRWSMQKRRSLTIHIGIGDFQANYISPSPQNALPRIESIRMEDGGTGTAGVYTHRDSEWFNLVRVDTFDRSILEWFLDSFRLIHTIEIAVDRADVRCIEHLIVLLDHFAPTLTHLTIWLGNMNTRCSDLFPQSYIQYKTRLVLQLLSVTSRMGALRKLVYEDTTISNITGDLDLPVLQHLSEFTFKTRDCPTILVYSLHRYAMHNNALVSINLGSVIASPQSVSAYYFRFVFELSVKFKYIHFDQTIFGCSVLREFFSILTSLNTVKLTMTTLSILQMVYILTPLRDLTYLSLEFPDYATLRYSHSGEYFELVTLPQVKVLEIALGQPYFGLDLTHLLLDTVFPNLQVFKLYDDLGEKSNGSSLYISEMMIARCPLLRKVVFNGEILFWDDRRGGQVVGEMDLN